MFRLNIDGRRIVFSSKRCIFERLNFLFLLKKDDLRLTVTMISRSSSFEYFRQNRFEKF